MPSRFMGRPRYTGDIDILIRPTPDNASRTLAAIAAFGFSTTDLTADDLMDSQRMLEMGVEPVQIHVRSCETKRAAGRLKDLADVDALTPGEPE